MFPPRLAAETLSLRLNEPRCAVSVSAVIDADGDVREYWIGPSTVTVTHAMSDADVDAALREDEENAGKTGAKTHPALALLVEAAARRRRRRERDGAINVATPECIVKVRTREEGSDSDSDSDGRGKNGGAPLRCVLYTGPHTTPLARWTPILKDFCRRLSPPTPRFQSPTSTPFNSN